MILRLAAMLALLVGCVSAASAQTAQWPEGVWRGTIGTLPVQVCLERDGLDQLRGSYFYMKHLRPIALEHASDVRLKEAGGAAWALTKGESGALNGTWRAHKRTLALRLVPQPWTAREVWDSPCGSAAFIAPRLRPVTVSRHAPTEPTATPYDEVRYNVGPAFDSVDIVSFALPDTLPGDRAINAAAMLDPLKASSIADFAECMAGNLSSMGIDGDFSLRLTPTAVRGDFLSVAVTQSTYCGGAHPSSSISYRTFDRRSGAELAIRDWLGEAAIVTGDAEDDGAVQLSSTLRTLALARYPRRDDEDADECASVIADAEFWTVALTSAGLSFEPSLPHVAQACADSAVVPFEQLGPYLSVEGMAGMTRIAGAQAAAAPR